jgi:hypothetical protein
MTLDRNIILIGPSKAGKTTVAELLGQRLNLPVVALDDLRWDYYAEIGYDPDYAKQIRREQGFPALVEYWKPFDIHGVERVLAGYPQSHIIAFGAGHSVYADPGYLERAKQALAGHHVILLMPAPDIEDSSRILQGRLLKDEPELVGTTIPMVNRQLMQDPSNVYLATATIYNANQTPEQTCTAIIEMLGL